MSDTTSSGAAAGSSAASAGVGFVSILVTTIIPICGALCVLLIYIAIVIVILTIVARVVRRIPPEHRKLEPWHVYLNMIPLFNLVWHFFTYPRISQSFQSAFRSKGDMSGGDCAETLAWVFCIAFLCMFIPVIGQLAWIASIVVFVIMVIQFYDLASRLEMNNSFGYEAGYQAPPPMMGAPAYAAPPAEGQKYY